MAKLLGDDPYSVQSAPEVRTICLHFGGEVDKRTACTDWEKWHLPSWQDTQKCYQMLQLLGASSVLKSFTANGNYLILKWRRPEQTFHAARWHVLKKPVKIA